MFVHAQTGQVKLSFYREENTSGYLFINICKRKQKTKNDRICIILKGKLQFVAVESYKVMILCTIVAVMKDWGTIKEAGLI